MKKNIKKKLVEYLDNKKEEASVKKAYVVFRSMEGRARLLRAYEPYNCCTKKRRNKLPLPSCQMCIPCAVCICNKQRALELPDKIFEG